MGPEDSKVVTMGWSGHNLLGSSCRFLRQLSLAQSSRKRRSTSTIPWRVGGYSLFCRAPVDQLRSDQGLLIKNRTWHFWEYHNLHPQVFPSDNRYQLSPFITIQPMLSRRDSVKIEMHHFNNQSTVMCQLVGVLLGWISTRQNCPAVPTLPLVMNMRPAKPGPNEVPKWPTSYFGFKKCHSESLKVNDCDSIC